MHHSLKLNRERWGKRTEEVFKHTIHKAYRAQGQQETDMYKGNMGVLGTIPATLQEVSNYFPKKVKKKTPPNDPENLK